MSKRLFCFVARLLLGATSMSPAFADRVRYRGHVGVGVAVGPVWGPWYYPPASLLLSAVSPVSSYSDHRAAGAAACLYRAISARAGENGLLVLLPIPLWRILPIRQGVSGWLVEGCAPILRQDSVRRNQS